LLVKRKQIVILGGGTGGTMTANRLRRRFDADEAEIHVVDRDDSHVYQPGLLFVPFGLTSVEEIIRPRSRQLRDGVVFHECEVEAVWVERDEVLLGAGRVANYSGVENAGLKTERLGIVVDERMRTNVSGVWAIGDCIGDPRAPKLAHVASTQGEVAVDVILGEDAKMDYDVVPNVVYTHPEVATVGLTEAQAKEKYPEAKSSRFSFKASGRALALGESDGLMKLVTAGPHGRILGAHIVGPNASELIAEATLAMRLESTTDDVIATIHAHPTLAETFREAALVAAGTAIHTSGR